MSSKMLYQFLTKKCKERKLHLETLPKIFGFSRSSLYRYMKGIVQMSPDVQEKFIQIFNFDHKEEEEFRNIVDMSRFDSETIAARYALDSYVFDNEKKATKTPGLQFVYFDNDKFLRDFQEIFEEVHSQASKHGHECIIRIVGCVGLDNAQALTIFLKQVLDDFENVKIEHLIRFSDKDRLYNINALFGILSFLQHTRYEVYCGTSFAPRGDKCLFGDVIIIGIYKNKSLERQFFISMHDESLSTCLVTPDLNVASFINLNYDTLRANYDSSFLGFSSIDTFSSGMADLEETTNYYLLKPNFCYHRIPSSVYRSMIARLDVTQLAQAQEGLYAYGGSLESGLAVLERRAAASYMNTQIDVHSQSGLMEFARTGRLSDHFVFFPSLEITERRCVLEYIRNRNTDPSDPYKLYVTRESFFKNGYIFVALENIGVLVEYSKTAYKDGQCANIFIRNKMFADILSDYVKKHIPNEHALSMEESTSFLNELIARLG